MSDESVSGSITRLLAELRDGNQKGLIVLWERYFERLVNLARQQLKSRTHLAADGEDVAISALQSLCHGIERGKFPELHDRNDLWKLLVVITRNKATDLRRQHYSQKKGLGKVRGDSVFPDGQDGVGVGFDRFLEDGPSLEFLVQLSEEHERRISLLVREPRLKQIALLKFESYTNQEIAEYLGIAVSTVERKIKRIREIWLEDLDQNEE